MKNMFSFHGIYDSNFNIDILSHKYCNKSSYKIHCPHNYLMKLSGILFLKLKTTNF